MKSLLIALNILVIIACFAMALSIRFAPQWTATERSGAVAVWLWTPYLSPGDTAEFDVDVVGGKRSGINSIELTGDGLHQSWTGKGADWGGVIVSKSGDVGHSSHDISVKVPDTLNVGDTWLVKLNVEYTLAISGGGTFNNERDIDSVTLLIPIRSNSSAILGRVWSAAWPTLIFGAATVFFALAWHRLGGLLKKEPADPSEKNLYAGLGTFLIAGFISWVFFGWAYFAIPWTAATGITSAWFQFGMAALFLAGPPLLGRKFAPRPPPESMVGTLRRIHVEPERNYRQAPDPRPAKPSLADLGKAIEQKLNLRWRIRSNQLIVGRSRWDKQLIVKVSNPKKIKPSDIEIKTPEAQLAIRACEAWLPLLGPVDLNLDFVPVTIDGSRPAEDVEKEWNQRHLDRMWEQINALRKQIDERLKARIP